MDLFQLILSIGSTVAIPIIVYVYYRLVRRITGKKDDDIRGKLDKLSTLIKKTEIQTRKKTIVDEKKDNFLSVPNVSFHFANKPQISDFYNDYFKEPTIANLVSEISGEKKDELKGNLPQILEAKTGSKNLTKWISTVKLPDLSISSMFLRYQRETIKSGQVQLGLEEVEIELSQLHSFDRAITSIQKRYEFKIDDGLIKSHHIYLKEKAAERTLQKLEQASGWILVEGKFIISNEGEFYKCSYSHPINEYLSNQIIPISISVLIPIKDIEPHIAGNYRQSIGRMIPMNIYGKVWQPIDRENSIWDLQLTPLAIY